MVEADICETVGKDSFKNNRQRMKLDGYDARRQPVARLNIYETNTMAPFI